jgi:hypothetical protein
MFIQLVTLTSGKVDEITKIDEAWRQATAGRNTVLSERVYAHRDRPGTYTSVCEFASHDAAMANSALPETARAAEAIAGLCDGPITFTDLELVSELADRRAEIAELFVSFLETAEVPEGLFTDDVEVDLNVPQWNLTLVGPEAAAAVLREDSPEGWRTEARKVVATADGLVIEWSGHSAGADRRYCRQLATLELSGARVARATVYCTGNWDAATYAQWTREAGR